MKTSPLAAAVASSLLGLIAGLGACSKSPEPRNEPAAAPAIATTAAPPPAAPKALPFSASAADKLGSAPEGHGLALGAGLPDVQVTNLEGAQVALREVARGPALIGFYRGGWCPYCNFQIRETVQAYDSFQARGVTPVMISVDKPAEAAKTGAAYDIPFPVLSDSDLAAHEAFRVVYEATPEQYAALAGYGIDLEVASGKTHHQYALPSLFLFDADGKLVWQHVDPDYTVRPEIAQLIGVLEQQGLVAE